jgi:hypothetical protein
MKKTLIEKIKLSLYIFCGVVALVIVALIIKVRMDIAHLLKEGVRVKGAVISKSDSTSSSRKSTKSSYAMELSLFVDRSITEAPKANDAKPESFDAKMDALLAASKKRMTSRFKEGYANVTIKVSSDSYQKFSLGEVVDVVHLKDDPSSARLVVDIE